MRRTFRTLADARAWRAHAQTATRQGLLRAPSRVTLEDAARQWCAAAAEGVVRTRGGDRYKPSALRSYEQALRTHVFPRLGRERLSAVSRNAIQDMVDEMVAAGAAASTTRNAVLPLRAIFRRALARAEVMVNPTLGLALPAVRARRERVARPEEAAALIAAAPVGDRAVWATALYAGLRRGELMALRWGDVDFDAGLIRVERGWDQAAGPIEPKSRAGRRRVPMAQPLRAHLAAHRLAQGAAAELVFGRRGGQPFGQAVVNRARRAWRDAGIDGIGLHECRHTYAAFMIAAGVNAKALSTYMGHSSIVVTLDRYGHLMPGNEQEAAELLGAYLARNAL
ncbi:MAG TPA: tyrosine-type recombinase/integrase [Solirubrobacteraceae bacterium]